MTHIATDKVNIPQTAEKAFTFLSDFNNFKSLMPPQVTNWQSTEDTCSFTINNMATVGMKIVSKEPFSKIHIKSDGGKVPFEFTLDVLITPDGDAASIGQLVFDADIPIFLRPMVEGPLGNFFNLLAKKMAEIK
ncbi:MAG TPA: SRPBCC family protein [Bacteroidia bacterium]|nr:SRPBCC family protein [Bacteroidia bacterium]